ncbi:MULTISPECIES: hypothetical protein [unclassified Streptomyces]
MIKLSKKPPATESAYRTWLGHTLVCADCRLGASCPTAVRLGRAWRKGRQ